MPVIISGVVNAGKASVVLNDFRDPLNDGTIAGSVTRTCSDTDEPGVMLVSNGLAALALLMDGV